jgi:hypothetical protein
MPADEPCGEAQDGGEYHADVEAGDGEEVGEAGVAEGGVGLGRDAATNAERECVGDGGLRLRDVTLDGVGESSTRPVDASEGAGAGRGRDGDDVGGGEDGTDTAREQVLGVVEGAGAGGRIEMPCDGDGVAAGEVGVARVVDGGDLEVGSDGDGTRREFAFAVRWLDGLDVEHEADARSRDLGCAIDEARHAGRREGGRRAGG